jgi:hypothetical protein
MRIGWRTNEGGMHAEGESIILAVIAFCEIPIGI